MKNQFLRLVLFACSAVAAGAATVSVACDGVAPITSSAIVNTGSGPTTSASCSGTLVPTGGGGNLALPSFSTGVVSYGPFSLGVSSTTDVVSLTYRDTYGNALSKVTVSGTLLMTINTATPGLSGLFSPAISVFPEIVGLGTTQMSGNVGSVTVDTGVVAPGSYASGYGSGATCPAFFFGSVPNYWGGSLIPFVSGQQVAIPFSLTIQSINSAAVSASYSDHTSGYFQIQAGACVFDSAGTGNATFGGLSTNGLLQDSNISGTIEIATNAAAVPEPATTWLAFAAAGFLGLTAYRRRLTLLAAG